MTTVTEKFDSAGFRRVLGHFPTGVVVVAAMVDGRPEGLAVNSFTSVSLDPPLVSFCAAATSSTWPRLRRATGFAITLLGRDQEDCCRVFASKGADRFGSVAWTPSPAGHPVLDGALAWLDAEPHAVHEAGDHELALVRVTALGSADGGRPLVFFRGGFTGLATPPAPARHPADPRGLDTDSPFFDVLSARLGAPSS
ncbi:flavin reductase family protein [Actinomadura parmotrematis]|uniref:Flavin reductase family protein n=1 Tax=Actinomadura parmotrematis TaxID=2864039 RepID=A0ABS7FZH5_9ACTN|nr:flavin reductase family protein [Actinomadura parmotrematis]MBW8485854.1 flavin reductase family protein [Actinomadura parmotrematis]